jgi:hypothetical protein
VVVKRKIPSRLFKDAGSVAVVGWLTSLSQMQRLDGSQVINDDVSTLEVCS